MNALLLHLLFAGICMGISDPAYKENLQPAYAQYHLAAAVVTCAGIAAVHEFVIDDEPDYPGFRRSLAGISGMTLILWEW